MLGGDEGEVEKRDNRIEMGNGKVGIFRGKRNKDRISRGKEGARGGLV